MDLKSRFQSTLILVLVWFFTSDYFRQLITVEFLLSKYKSPFEWERSVFENFFSLRLDGTRTPVFGTDDSWDYSIEMRSFLKERRDNYKFGLNFQILGLFIATRRAAAVTISLVFLSASGSLAMVVPAVGVGACVLGCCLFGKGYQIKMLKFSIKQIVPKRQCGKDYFVIF